MQGESLEARTEVVLGSVYSRFQSFRRLRNITNRYFLTGVNWRVYFSMEMYRIPGRKHNTGHTQTHILDMIDYLSIFLRCNRRKIAHSLRRPIRMSNILLSLGRGQCTQIVTRFWLSVEFVTPKKGTETPVQAQVQY
jgi:hypothetical protein